MSQCNPKTCNLAFNRQYCVYSIFLWLEDSQLEGRGFEPQHRSTNIYKENSTSFKTKEI
jgi:hypothetical protein